MALPVLALGIAFAGGCAGHGNSLFAGDDGGPAPSPPGDDECSCCGPDGGGCGDDVGPMGPKPQFGPTTTASVPPPPVSGGTLLVMNDGNTAVASDPDRDAVYVVDVKNAKVLFTVSLHAGDEPGRLVEDAAGRVQVALRGGGALVTIDPKAGTVTGRRSVCPAPRGVAYDATTDAVWVACATGELVSLPAAGGAATKSLVVERDLRDVIIQNGQIVVTKFRSAEVLRLAADGSIAQRSTLPSAEGSMVPHVAWRAIAGPSGGMVIAHQEETTQAVPTHQPHAYGGTGGTPVVDSVVTVLDSTGAVLLNQAEPMMVLPVDVALSPDGKGIALIAAGDELVTSMQNTIVLSMDGTQRVVTAADGLAATAVAYDAAGDLLVQVREPAALQVVDPSGQPRAIPLASASRDDTGHDIFHAEAGGFIACASCHPEGGDDGHVWMLDGQPRRTPSLRGTIAGTAPYHWPGDQPDLTALAADVYTNRMGGAALASDQMSALQHWVEAIPAPPAPSWVDAAAVQRGQAIFQREDVGCSSCHSGAKYTNNATVNVGTGGAFQVPPLVGVGWRTPLLHNGCAATIADRFGKCATAQHGVIGSLSSQDLSDLGAYLESL